MVANQVFTRAILRERAALASLRALMVDAGDFEVLAIFFFKIIYDSDAPSFLTSFAEASLPQQCAHIQLTVRCMVIRRP